MRPVTFRNFQFMHFRHIKSYFFHPLKHFAPPIFKIFFPISLTDKIFYFHLLKFALTEKKISGCYFVSKSFADLRHAERKFRMKSINGIFKIHEHSLRGLRTEIRDKSFFPYADLRFEHFIKIFATKNFLYCFEEPRHNARNQRNQQVLRKFPNPERQNPAFCRAKLFFPLNHYFLFCLSRTYVYSTTTLPLTGKAMSLSSLVLSPILLTLTSTLAKSSCPVKIAAFIMTGIVPT